MIKKPKESLVDKAYSLIKKKIITLEFKPGMKLEEKALISEIGIGRTPIREAIKMLISEGLIISFGKNSIYVKELTLKSARDLMSLLYYLGDVIFSLASRNEDYTILIRELENHLLRMEEAIRKEEYSDFALHNSKFHKTLAKISGNEYLEALFDKLYNEEKRLSFIISLEKLNGDPIRSYYEKVQEQHQELVELLKTKNFEGLKKAYQTHMKVGQTRLFRYFSQ